MKYWIIKGWVGNQPIAYTMASTPTMLRSKVYWLRYQTVYGSLTDVTVRRVHK